MQKKPYDPNEERTPLFPVEEMNTMTEMTGLIPSGMESQEEAENYEHMFPFLPGKDGGEFFSVKKKKFEKIP